MLVNYIGGVGARTRVDETLAEWARVRPDLDTTAMGTVLRLGQLMALAARRVDEVFRPLGITLGEFDVLAALRRAGPGAARSPGTLARLAMVTPAGMTGRLDRLEAAGLVRRRPDPDDRRGTLVALTPAGAALADRAVEDLVASEEAVLSALAPRDRQRLDASVDRLVDRLEELAAPPGGAAPANGR